MIRRFILLTALIVCTVGGSYAAVTWGWAQTPPRSVTADPRSYRDVVKSVLPAVVSIDSKANPAKSRRRPGRPADEEPQAPDNFRKFFEDLERRQIETPQNERTIGFGSGFIIDAKGVVLTNYHVVVGAETAEITLGDGRKFTSKDIKGDERTDLAIIRFDPKGAKLPWIELGDSSEMEIGDRVLAVGAPFGLSGSVTQGIISAKGRDLKLNRYDDFLQTDAAINPGNSGGPLVNLDAKVVGINSAIKSGTGGFQGVGMAISSNMARSVVQQLMRDGTVKRPYLGIEAVMNLTPDAAAQYGLRDGGVVIAKVRDNSPAAKGGLRSDDAIVTLNGKAVHDIRELQRVIASQPISASIDVGILRETRPMNLKVTLEEEPTDYTGTPGRRQRRPANLEEDTVSVGGMELATVSAAFAEGQGLPAKAGVMIVSVERGSLAETAGLNARMMVLKVNRKPIQTSAEAKQLIETGLGDEGALLHVQTGETVSIVMLKVR